MADRKGALNYPSAEHEAYRAQQEKVDNFDLFPAWTAAQKTGPTKGSPNLVDDYGAAIATPFILGYTGPRYLYEKWKANKLEQQYLDALKPEAEYKSTGGLQGYGSASGWGGMNDAYLEELPQYEYGKTDTGKNFTYGSAPLSDSNDPSGGGAANQPTAMNVWDYNLPATSPYSNPETARNFDTSPHGWNPTTAESMWDKLDDKVYNSGTGEWQDSGKWSYPGSKFFPERMGALDNLLTFGTTNPTGDRDYRGIAQDLANSQQRESDLFSAWSGTGAPLQDYIDLVHHDFSGFDKQGNYSPVQGSKKFEAMDENMQRHFTTNPFVSGAMGDQGFNAPKPEHTGSVFDEGGIFSSSFWKNKGGPVSGGK
jgi:hypothetical protein